MNRPTPPHIDIIPTCIRLLRDAGSRRWDDIAAELGRDIWTIKALAYGRMPNAGAKLCQSVLDYFADVAAGRRELPKPRPIKRRERVTTNPHVAKATGARLLQPEQSQQVAP